jgi:DNA-binding XRE family transcriptional regulator
MRTDHIIDHFGSRAKVAEAIGYSRQAIYRWERYVPEAAAYRIEAATKGLFKVDPRLYRRRA